MYYSSNNSFSEELVIDREDGEEEDGEIDEIIYTTSPLETTSFSRKFPYKTNSNSFVSKTSADQKLASNYACSDTDNSVHGPPQLGDSGKLLEIDSGPLFPAQQQPLETLNGVDEETSQLHQFSRPPPMLLQPQSSSLKRNPLVASPVYECLFRILPILDVQKLVIYFEREVMFTGFEYFCFNNQRYLRFDSIHLDDIPFLLFKCKEFEKRLDVSLPSLKELVTPILLVSITESSYNPSYHAFSRYQVFQPRGQKSPSGYPGNLYHHSLGAKMPMPGVGPPHPPFHLKPPFHMHSQQQRWKFFQPELLPPKNLGHPIEQNFNIHSQPYNISSVTSNDLPMDPSERIPIKMELNPQQHNMNESQLKSYSMEDNNEVVLPSSIRPTAAATETPEIKPSVTCVPSLFQNRESPVSMWCEHLSIDAQIQDFRELSSRFKLTNRYILLYFLPIELQNEQKLETVLVEAIRQKNFRVKMLEVETSMFSDSKDASAKMITGHVSFKTQKNAEAAAKNLQLFLTSPGKPASLRSFRFEYTGPLKPNSTLWVGNVQEFVSDKAFQDGFMNLFTYFGPVSRFKLIPERNCAFVEYSNIEQAKLARNYIYGFCFGTPEQYIVLNIDFAAESSCHFLCHRSSDSNCYFCKVSKNMSLKEYIDSIVSDSSQNKREKRFSEGKLEKSSSSSNNNNVRLLSLTRNTSAKDNKAKWNKSNRNFLGHPGGNSGPIRAPQPYAPLPKSDKNVSESLDSDTLSVSEKWWQKKTHRRTSSQSYDSYKQLKKQRRYHHIEHPTHTEALRPNPPRRYRHLHRHAEYRHITQQRSTSSMFRRNGNNNNETQKGRNTRKTEPYKHKVQTPQNEFLSVSNEEHKLDDEQTSSIEGQYQQRVYESENKLNQPPVLEFNADQPESSDTLQEDSFIMSEKEQQQQQQPKKENEELEKEPFRNESKIPNETTCNVVENSNDQEPQPLQQEDTVLTTNSKVLNDYQKSETNQKAIAKDKQEGLTAPAAAMTQNAIESGDLERGVEDTENENTDENISQTNQLHSITTSTVETTSESEMHEGGGDSQKNSNSMFNLKKTVNDDISTNNVLTSHLQKQGQSVCTIRLLLEKAGSTTLTLPLVINVITRTTEEKLCSRLEKRPNAFTIWKLLPHFENEKDAYCALWQYFKTRNRVGLLEDSAIVIFIVPAEPETLQEIYRTLFRTPCKQPTIYAFICSKKLCKIQ